MSSTEASAARRTAVVRNGRRYQGVYERIDSEGRTVYEIDFYDSSGKRRWRIVGPSLREAVALREELRSKRRRGERISPSKVTLREAAEAWLLEVEPQLRPRTVVLYRS